MRIAPIGEEEIKRLLTNINPFKTSLEISPAGVYGKCVLPSGKLFNIDLYLLMQFVIVNKLIVLSLHNVD